MPESRLGLNCVNRDKGGVYCITNLNDGRGTTYVGSTRLFKNRWRQHLGNLRRECHFNIKLQRAYNKYGESSFWFTVLEIVEDRKSRIKAEQYWLDQHLEIGRVYNCSTTTQSPAHDEEVRRKISAGLAHPYPSLININTGEIIPAGTNIAALCRRRGLGDSKICQVISGKRGIHKGWRLNDGKPYRNRKSEAKTGHPNYYFGMAYPALINDETGEIIPPGKNVAALCRKHNLQKSNMCHLLQGKQLMHKGWRLLDDLHSYS